MRIILVYDDIFELMVPHYQKAISFPFKDTRAYEALAEHIITGYLRELPNQTLDNPDSLISSLIKSGNSAHIQQIISFLWMEREDYIPSPSKAVVVEYKNGKTQPKVIESGKAQSKKSVEAIFENIGLKVIDFWRYVVKIYSEKSDKTNDDKEILASLSKLAVFLPQLDDESVKWIMLSAPYVELGFSSSSIIDYLNQLKDRGDKIKNAQYIVDIFGEMLKTFTPEFQQEHIQSLMDFVCEYGASPTKDKAKAIFNTYAKRGREDILSEVYKKHKDKL